MEGAKVANAGRGAMGGQNVRAAPAVRLCSPFRGL